MSRYSRNSYNVEIDDEPSAATKMYESSSPGGASSLPSFPALSKASRVSPRATSRNYAQSLQGGYYAQRSDSRSIQSELIKRQIDTIARETQEVIIVACIYNYL